MHLIITNFSEKIYLKVIYNHIQSFSYNIDANISEVKTGNGGIKYKDLELTIEGFITYNCPDTNSSEDSVEANSEKYYTYDEVVPDNSFGFHLIEYEEQGEYGLQEQNYSSSVYDPITNTYSVKITKTYKIKRVNFSEVFKYTIKDEDRAFIIASDGLWEYMPNQEVTEAVKEIILDMRENTEVSADIIANELFKQSVIRWRQKEPGMDDITIICVLLNQK